MSAIECNEYCPRCGGPLADIRVEDGDTGRFLGYEVGCVGECVKEPLCPGCESSFGDIDLTLAETEQLLGIARFDGFACCENEECEHCFKTVFGVMDDEAVAVAVVEEDGGLRVLEVQS